jgi:hypothetical protein
MRGVIFFMYLCFLLLKGVGFVHAMVYHDKMNYPPVQYLEKRQRGKCTNTSLSFGAIKDGGSPNEEAIVCDDVEDDDDDASNLSVRKYKMLTGPGAPFPHALVVNYLYGCYTDKLLYYGYLPDKYITQRALRI